MNRRTTGRPLTEYGALHDQPSSRLQPLPGLRKQDKTAAQQPFLSHIGCRTYFLPVSGGARTRGLNHGTSPVLFWFAQLEAVALRIYCPAKPASEVVRDFAIYLNSCLAQLRKQAVQVINTIVDHELRLGGVEVFRSFGKYAPHRESHNIGVILVPPEEHRRFALLSAGAHADAQMLFIPLLELRGIFRLEEYSANAGDVSTIGRSWLGFPCLEHHATPKT